MRRRALLLGAIAMFAAVVSGCGRKQDDVIARVNNRPITRTQLREALEKENYGETARLILDSLIVRDLIREEAKKRDIEVSKEELDRRVDALKDYILAGTGKDFATWLADTGQTEDDIRAETSVKILLAKLVLTETDREKYFQDNKQRLMELPHNNESVIYREIVVGSQQEAEAVRKELLAQAKEGKVSDEAFAKVAEERSLDPNGRRRGGMAGWVIKGKAVGLGAKTEETLFKLPPGEISEPLAVSPPAPPQEKGKEQPAAPPQPEFYRVVMVDKHVRPGPLTLANNEDIVEEWMMGDPRNQVQLKEFLANLRAKADIQVTDPRYRALQEAYKQGREARDRRMAQPGAVLPGPQPGVGGPAGQPPRGEGRPGGGGRPPTAPLRRGR
jgi:parvulin-like peptidyl-prolyl isomerase